MTPRVRATFVARRLLAEWRNDRVPDLAAEIAFYAVLSLLPAFVALAAVLGVLDAVASTDVATSAEEFLVDTLGDILTQEADGTIAVVDDLFAESRPGLLSVSLVAALYGVSRAFASLVRALDVVYDIDEHRSFLRIRLTAVALSIGSVLAAAVLLGMIVVGPLFGNGEQLADDLGLGPTFEFLWDVARWPVALALLIAWAATIFHIAPDHSTPWRADLPGAVLVAVGWAAISFGLRTYLQVASAGGSAVFGALGGVLIVLLWFWALALVVLVGGELNEILLEDPDDPDHALPDGPSLRDRLESLRDALPRR